MTTDIEREQPTGFDRRAALKKAAIAAGAVAWATPTIQALTPGVAAATTRFTACFGAFVQFQPLAPTGAHCECVAAPSPSCCSNHTFATDVSAALFSCGPNCPASNLVIDDIVGARRSCISGNQTLFLDIGNCSGIAILTITGTLTCADGTPRTFSEQLSVDCSKVCVPTGPTTTTTSTPGQLTEQELLTPGETTTTTESPTTSTSTATESPTTTTESPTTTTESPTTTTAAPTTAAPTTAAPTTAAPTTAAPPAGG